MQENRTFRLNPSAFLRTESHRHDAPLPPVADVQSFWQDLYEKVEPFNADAQWIGRFKSFCDDHLKEVDPSCPLITPESVRAALKGKRNFSAPGPDRINNLWWKRFPSTHFHIARNFHQILEGNQPIPSWLVEGRTVLISKGGDTTQPKNYRPITCLNTLYKTFTGILNENTLSEIAPIWQEISEQRGCKRGLAGCKENLLVDRTICSDSVHYKRNLSMAWVDYRKAFDTTNHQYLTVLLKCLQVHSSTRRCLTDLMGLWRTRFSITSGGKKVLTDYIQFRRGVFQGDSLSPLLFCISLLPLSVELRQMSGYMAGPPNCRTHRVTHLFYMDDLKVYASIESRHQQTLEVVLSFTHGIGMEFGLEKCAVIHLNRGRCT